MSTLDELWAWIYSPLHDLTDARTADRDKSWDDLRAYFLERAGLREPSENPLVDDLVKQLDEMSGDDRDGLLGDSDKLDKVVYELAQQHADTDQVEAEAGADYDEAAWQEYLERNGANWNGDEASWSQFKEWLLYYAAESGFSRPATELVNYLDTQTTPDRITILAQYGVIVQTAQQTNGEAADEPGTEQLRALFADDPDFASLAPDQQRQTLTQLRDALGG